MFDCLIDGLCVLSFGQEAKYNTLTKKAQAEKRDNTWEEICHYDLKPQNGSRAPPQSIFQLHTNAHIVVLGEHTMTHEFTPVLKVGSPTHIYRVTFSMNSSPTLENPMLLTASNGTISYTPTTNNYRPLRASVHR